MIIIDIFIRLLRNRDLYDILFLFTSILIPIITAIINVHYVNWNTNKQIENQNKETYRPRLRIKSIEESFDMNNHTIYAYSNFYDESKYDKDICVYNDYIHKKFFITFENIGNGMANELEFYMLNHGEKCSGYQSLDDSLNQVLNSTIEIPKGSADKVCLDICFDKNRYKIEDFINEKEDFIIIICNYKDLNNNNYNILFGIILKKVLDDNFYENYGFSKDSIIFDYYYYQEKTKDYNNMVSRKMYKDNYDKIVKMIKNS